MYDIFSKELADEYVQNNLRTIEAGTMVELLERTLKPDGTIAIYKVFKFPMQIDGCTMIGGWSVEITQDARLQQEMLMQEENKKRAVVRSIIETQEKERRALSVQLHDHVNQTLSSCKIMLEAALQQQANSYTLAQKAYSNLQQVIGEIRKISYELNPSSLQDIGLQEAIEDLVEHVHASSGLPIEFAYKEEEMQKVLKPEDKIAIFRIVQEQLHNIIQHAKANRVLINLEIRNTQVHLSIEDDGIGFDAKKVPKGIGFRNIQNRVDYYFGKLHIEAKTGKGCQMNVTLNLS